MILTIDVGLKNLAMCIMDSETNIHLWEVYNTLEQEQHTCTNVLKNGKTCGKKCLFKYKDTEKQLIFTCKSHFPKTIKVSNSNKVVIKMVKDYLLQDIAKIILSKIDDIFKNNEELLRKITNIQIELQPKVNNKMKFVSHIIYGKLVELYMDNPTTSIRFVRASQKLKAYTGPVVTCNLKNPYGRRKYLSVEYTKWFIRNDKSTYDKFMSHTKKDDLADVYLMAINSLKYIT